MTRKAAEEGFKILIVDDEPFNFRVLKLKFENSGHQVFLARNGHEGLEKFHQENPDVVITDINMPIMDCSLDKKPGRIKKETSVDQQEKPAGLKKINGNRPSVEMSIEESIKAPQDMISSELSGRDEELNLISQIGQKLRLDHNQNVALVELIEDAAQTLNADIGNLFLKSKYGVLEKNMPAFSLYQTPMI